MPGEVSLEVMLRKLVENHTIELKTIDGPERMGDIEVDAEYFEGNRQRENAIALRISLALYNDINGKSEQASYEASKAAADALHYNRLLNAQLRHIAAIGFSRELGSRSGINSQRDERILREICLNALYAADAYLGLTGYEEIGKVCFDMFLKDAVTIEIRYRDIRSTLRNIRNNCPDLEPNIEAYCERVHMPIE